MDQNTKLILGQIKNKQSPAVFYEHIFSRDPIFKVASACSGSGCAELAAKAMVEAINHDCSVNGRSQEPFEAPAFLSPSLAVRACPV